MRALSVKQPWAMQIALGQKIIELRSWATDYRGDLLICASAAQDRAFYPLDEADFPLGYALCVVSVVGCEPMSRDLLPCAFPNEPDEFRQHCDITGLYGWQLDNPRIISPYFKVKGRLHFYDVPLPPNIDLVPLKDFLKME